MSFYLYGFGHEHDFGPTEASHFAGTLHRRCQVDGCRAITLDLNDESEDE